MIETPSSSSWSSNSLLSTHQAKMGSDCHCLLERRWTSGPGMGTNRQAIGSIPGDNRFFFITGIHQKQLPPETNSEKCWVNPVYLDLETILSNLNFIRNVLVDFKKNWWKYLWEWGCVTWPCIFTLMDFCYTMLCTRSFFIHLTGLRQFFVQMACNIQRLCKKSKCSSYVRIFLLDDA